jgi:hypothetical protein
MRKLTILLACAVLASASTGCVGRCKNWFAKGSPCGTLMSAPPAMLSAPVAMGAPMMAPMVQQQQPICIQQAPMCMPACDPCMQYDPCATTGVSSGYFGGYVSGADCNCAGSAGTVISGGTLAPTTVDANGNPITPYPLQQ